jgi:NADPH:quinone reductase-like Zn-dependent oxidoreductase
MKAIRYYRYGAPEVLQFEDVDKPELTDDSLLIRVKAASVNPLDFHLMRGTPYLVRLMSGISRPKSSGLGADMAGVVEAVGLNVSAFQPGDEVYGGGTGTLAEYVTRRHDKAVLRKPSNLTFEQAAAVPIAGFTALQALRDKAHVQAGQKVLVNGAGGGVGTFAVQIAKAYGASVTGVCSTAKVDMVRSIGADDVVDYTTDDVTASGRRYDVIIDMAGNWSLKQIKQLLAPAGILVGVGAPEGGKWIGPLAGLGKTAVASAASKQKLLSMLARQTRDDLAVLSGLLESGKVTPVIDRSYPLSEAAEAIGYLEAGHASGKVVVTI